MAKGPGGGESVKSAEQIRLENNARHILFGTHYVSNFLPHPDIQVTKIKKQTDGYYAVTYKQHPKYGPKRTVSLDLDFPLAQENIATIVARYQKAGRQLFLSVGADTNDYPKIENADPSESRRAFFVSDKGYGIVANRENFALFHDATPKEHFHSKMPHETFLFNGLDAEYPKLAEDTFDTIQLVNILSDPSSIGLRLHELIRTLKRGSGEMVIVNTNTPDVFPLEALQKVATSEKCSLEIIFHRNERGKGDSESETKYMIPEEIVERMQQDYHISPQQFTDNSSREAGCYAAIIRKPAKTNE